MSYVKKPKAVEPVVEVPMTIEEIGHFRHVQRVKEQVEGAGSVSRAAWGLKMSVEDIQALLDANP